MLERRISRMLEGLPDRGAPASLEARVLSRIGRRSARRSWMGAAQRALLGLSGVLGGGIIYAALKAGPLLAAWLRSVWIGSGADRVLAPLGILIADGIDSTVSVVSSIPTVFYELAAVCGLAGLVILAGLGAAAYRTFQKHES